MFKGTLPQNIFILKSCHIGHKNSLNIGVLKKLLYKFGRNSNLSYFLDPETMSPLDGSNADFAPHMEESHADCSAHGAET